MTTYSLADLVYLMDRLRDPSDGCSWDLKQTYRSVAPSTLEEAYEVVDCIEREDYDGLRDELGDLLFQIVFYARVASEEQRFSFDNVVSDLVGKLVRRHPHVFPTGDLRSRAADSIDVTRITQQWEEIKGEERRSQGQHSLMDNIPTHLPALVRAQKMQKRAASAGFDWRTPLEVMPKLREELAELEEAIGQADADAIAEEVGDLLFTCVNLARKLKLDSEQTLRRASTKFENRFRYMEQAIESKGLSINNMGADQLEESWEEAKTASQI